MFLGTCRLGRMALEKISYFYFNESDSKYLEEISIIFIQTAPFLIRISLRFLGI